MFKKLGVVVLVGMISACSSNQYIEHDESDVKIVLRSEVDWQHLNPARADKAPKAGTLWGNRNENLATGFLLKPKDGFESPPHIHNISYRGIVIKGLIHNDDPNATTMWMPAGSYWTQPKGETHITAAKGEDSLAYIEIEQGPYLVKPTTQSFDSGERPVNVDESNLVWLGKDQIDWLSLKNDVQVSYLWGQPTTNSVNGRLVKLPAGFKGKLKTESTEFRVVIIQGFLDLKLKNQEVVLEPGSYFSSTGKAEHELINYDANDVILYIRTRGEFLITD